MKKQKNVSDAADVAESKALIMHKKELEKTFFCGCCSVGFNDLEEYRNHHNNDEEHKYYVERRVKKMVPGLGYCAACSQLVQNSNYWKTHIEFEKHSKCIASLCAIGISEDYDRPVGCTVRGQLGEPINHTGINYTVANSNGYGKASNIAGVPIIGLNFVKQVSDAVNQDFKCEVCDNSFNYTDRLVHLSGVKHRQLYLKKYYSEWNEEILKIPDILKQHIKNRLSFFAHKVEQLEKENETSDAKVLREKFFNLEKFLQFTKDNSKRKAEAKKMQNQGGPVPRRDGGPIHIIHTNRHTKHGQRSGAYEHGPSRFQAPLPRSDGRSQGYDDARFGDRREPIPAPKRLRSGTYSEQYEMDQALEAFNVLERFSVTQAEQEIRDKIQKMRDAVLRGSRLSDLQVYGDMMSSMKGRSGDPPLSVGQASPPPGHFPRTPFQEDLVDQPQSHRRSEYRGAHFGGPPTPEYMHQGHHVERPGHYRR